MTADRLRGEAGAPVADAISIQGGVALDGIAPVSGAKNAALGMIAATLLGDQPIRLGRVPKVRDVDTMLSILETLGVAVWRRNGEVEFDAAAADKCEPPERFVTAMRASIMLLGPLLARFGRARLALPGGCALGDRPVDLHIRGLEALGAVVELEHGTMLARAPAGGLRGADIRFPVATVTGTGNLMMAACLAKGTTRLANAAMEPEVLSLASMLRAMGAQIEGAGTPQIEIQGVAALRGAEQEIAPDRIEAGTWLAAAAATGGRVLVRGVGLQIGAAVEEALRGFGLAPQAREDGVLLDARDATLRGQPLATAPHPGFPTDLQAQFMAVAALARGVSRIEEGVFHQRFAHAAELRRLGANVRVRGNKARVEGVARLSGAEVVASDLRAAAGLVIAGLAAEGETRVWGLGHLERGYEDAIGKLRGLGARIEVSRQRQPVP